MNLEKLKHLLLHVQGAEWGHVHVCFGTEAIVVGPQTEFERQLVGHIEYHPNAEFIVAARNALPALIERMEKLEAVVDAARSCMQVFEYRHYQRLEIYKDDVEDLQAAIAALDKG